MWNEIEEEKLKEITNFTKRLGLPANFFPHDNSNARPKQKAQHRRPIKRNFNLNPKLEDML